MFCTSFVLLAVIIYLTERPEANMSGLLPNKRNSYLGHCDICYETTNQMGYVLNCGHRSFCRICLSQLEKPICPMCRAPVTQINVEKQDLSILLFKPLHYHIPVTGFRFTPTS